MTSYNGALLIKKCKQCKSYNVATLTEGGFCFSCGNAVEVEEAIKLVGDIIRGTTTTEVTIVGEAVDKVLRFEDTVINLYKKNAIKTRFDLSDAVVKGFFLVDNQGRVIGFRDK